MPADPDDLPNLIQTTSEVTADNSDDVAHTYSGLWRFPSRPSSSSSDPDQVDLDVVESGVVHGRPGQRGPRGLSAYELDVQYGGFDGTLAEWLESLRPDPPSGGGEGTSDHTQLDNRDAPNQHPMAAVIGLVEALAAKASDDELQALKVLLGARNAANGFAGLDASGLLNESRIPGSITRDTEVAALVNATLLAGSGITLEWDDEAKRLTVSADPSGPGLTPEQEAALSALADLGERNAPDGYAGLDGSGLIDASALPEDLVRTADLNSAINALIGSAPGALDTLAELAAALGNDENFASTVLSAISDKLDAAHADETTDVHGIPNTADLVYTDDPRLSRLPDPTGAEDGKVPKVAGGAYVLADDEEGGGADGEVDLRAGLFIPIPVSDMGGSIVDDVLTLPFPLPAGTTVFTNGESTAANNKLWVAESGGTTLTPADDQPLRVENVGRVFSASSTPTGDAVVKVVGANETITEFFLKDLPGGLAGMSLGDLLDVNTSGAVGDLLKKGESGFSFGGLSLYDLSDMDPSINPRVWWGGYLFKGTFGGSEEAPQHEFFETWPAGMRILLDGRNPSMFVTNGTDTLSVKPGTQPDPGNLAVVSGIRDLDTDTMEYGYHLLAVAGNHTYVKVNGELEMHIGGKLSRAGGGGDLVHGLGDISGAVEIDLSMANVFTAALTGPVNLSFTGGVLFPGQWMLVLTGAESVVWPASCDWGAAGPPTLVAGRNRVVVMTEDGTTFDLSLAGQGFGA